ncbi:MAG: cysteine hydrolase [Novosphingobium sp.]|nr:cysteine hydrolase [Novosphingobium sp.]
MSSTALIVIDVQNGMFANPEMQPHGGDEFLARLSDLVTRARTAGNHVLFVQHDGGAGHPLEKPSETWEIHPGTGYQRGDAVVEKSECDAFHATDMQKRLEADGINRLVLAGMMTEFCVDTTCRRAFSLGYEVILASDGHSTFSREDLSADQIIQHHNSVLGSGFATLQPCSEITFSNAKVQA